MKMSEPRPGLALSALLFLGSTGLLFLMIMRTGPSFGPEETAFLVSAVTGGILAVERLVDYIRRAQPSRRGLTSGEMASLRLQEMERRMAALEAGDDRVADLEARLEFTERLLTEERKGKTMDRTMDR